MKTRRLLPLEERKLRIKATDPTLDAWVSAHAGSGKTRILRNRVIRLLLSGVPAEHILCLTYTRAAAAEMQGRIFEELARWVTLDDTALDTAIAELESAELKSAVGAPEGEAKKRAKARTLFAHAVETPGGLKVQTIHAFAERILHLFPIEAGVPLNFSLLSDEEADTLRAQARRESVEEAVRNPASNLGLAFGEVLGAVGLRSFEDGLKEALGVLKRLALGGHAVPKPETCAQSYRALFGITDNTTPERLRTEALAAFDVQDFEAAIEAIEAHAKGAKTQMALLPRLEAARQSLRSEQPDPGVVLAPFLKADGSLFAKSVFTGPVLKGAPEMEAFEARAKNAAREYFAGFNALNAALRSQAMLSLAQDVLARFERAKQARGLLDFDDLIGALRRLLVGGHASWLMLKLDGAIDHVLLDEAQDTTREMWEIIAALTEDFFAGEGARNHVRTLFAVGDEKQSIYSFQGADPAVFEEYRQHFAARSLRGDLIKAPVPLKYSFRSSDDVLGAVDAAFALPENREGLSARPEVLEHISADDGFPGLVEIWPPARPPAKDEPGGVSVLARDIATTIAQWLSAPDRHMVDGRPIQPGDILVLVRERKAFFHAILAALREAGVPVAGADTLTLQDEIVVRDLLSLAQALLTPADDLALAEVLRSPIFGLDDAALERLARGREGSLRVALAQSMVPREAAFATWLDAQGEAARRHSPFVFFAHLLSEDAPLCPGKSLRAVLAQALGADIHDPLNAFLNEALNFENEGHATVLAFVLAQLARETKLKREQEGHADKVRVMTVHGAKGLEGRIVFLADAHGTPKAGRDGAVLALRDAKGIAHPVWTGAPRAKDPDALRLEREARRLRLMGEYRRLLYVGMTRAAERLYVVSHAGPPASTTEIKNGVELPDPEDPMEASWYQLLRRSLTKAKPFGEDQTLGETLVGRFKRRISSNHPPAPDQPAPPSAVLSQSPPPWLGQQLPPEHTTANYNPSKSAQVPRANSGDTANPFARQRGIVLHKLFELLPRVAPEEREGTGVRLLELLAPDLGAPERPGFLAPVLTVLGGEVGARFFGQDSRAEVGVSGAVTLQSGETGPVSGRIDRLIVRANSVDILDIKTGKPHAAGQDASILRQMALYRALLDEIYPERAIECHILWLETATLETLPSPSLERAFAAISTLAQM